MMSTRVFLSFGLAALAAGGPVLGDGYNQWRGAERNGVTPGGPTLAPAWARKGPPLLWKNEELPPKGGAGYASIVTADGKAFLYTNWRYRVPFEERTLTKQNLQRLGWHEKLPPAELVQAVEKARVSEERAKLPNKERNEWVKKWVAEHLKTDEDKKKFRRFVTDRLNRGKKAMDLEVLAKLATIVDKEFANDAALDKWFAENGIDEKVAKQVKRVIPTYHQKAWDRIFCLGADGQKVWEYQDEGKPIGSGGSGTPCVADGKLYLAGSDGEVYCLDAATGKEVWKTRPYEKAGGVYSSLLVVDGAVVGQLGQLTCLDAATGEVRWRQPKVRGKESSPVAWKSGEKTYVLCNSGNLACVDLADGKLLWQVPGGSRCSTAVVAGDKVIVSTDNKKRGLLAYPLGPEKPEAAWSKPEVLTGGASPVVADGYVYVAGPKTVACVKIADGEVAWKQEIKGVDGWSSAVLADGKLICYSGRGAEIIQATPEKYNSLGRSALPHLQYTSPSVAGGKLYARLAKGVACYDISQAGVSAAAEAAPAEPKE